MSYRKVFSFGQRLQYGYYQFMDHFLGRPRSFKMHEKSRRKFYQKIHHTLKAKGEGRIIDIDRVKDIDLKTFKRKYVRKGIPVILDGAAKEWACCKEWSLDYFKALHGDDEIVMVDNESIENPYEQLTLADVIDDIRGGGSKYYRFYPLLVRHPEHLKDFDIGWLRSHRHSWSFAEAFQVFIGGKGGHTPIHNAFSNNLFVQAHGEKEWMIHPVHYTIVVDPEPARNLYRSAPFKTEAGAFDPFNPNYETPYTLFKYVDTYRAHLKEGDVLFNPPYYWHAVRNTTDSIGVGYRWVPPHYCFKTAPLYAFLDLFTFNPPIWKSWKLSKKDFNLVQLAETGRLDEYLEAQKKSK